MAPPGRARRPGGSGRPGCGRKPTARPRSHQATPPGPGTCQRGGGTSNRSFSVRSRVEGRRVRDGSQAVRGWRRGEFHRGRRKEWVDRDLGGALEEVFGFGRRSRGGVRIVAGPAGPSAMGATTSVRRRVAGGKGEESVGAGGTPGCEGRSKRHTPEERRAAVEAFHKSGRTQKAFARQGDGRHVTLGASLRKHAAEGPRRAWSGWCRARPSAGGGRRSRLSQSGRLFLAPHCGGIRAFTSRPGAVR